ncbi:MAG: methyltransferase domain-containing protein [Roseomonas sp.]|nr:methyltransferase domain-containing protein [Roseomonas sp.]
MTGELVCAVCGGKTFSDRAVIWDALAEGWRLTPEERAMVDRQQGTCCTGCGGNLRSIALAEAILNVCAAPTSLQAFVSSPAAASLRVLEINEAGTLSSQLSRLPLHTLAAYPAVDMRAMPYATGSFDLIVHSDTLEHVPEPERALAECARVLKADGAMCFTVPVLPGRLSLSRTGLPPLYHGDPANPTEDLLVQTDFGADIWHFLHCAGFGAVTLSRFADGMAITARLNFGAPPFAGKEAPMTGELDRTVDVYQQIRSEREWHDWAEAETTRLTSAVSQDIVKHVLEHGVNVPMFGFVPSSDVQMSGDEPRESLLALGLNARLRATLHVLAQHSVAYETWTTRIYAHEALTTFALIMRSRYPRFLGSEFAPDEAAARFLWPIPAVDVTQSPFPNDSFDIVLTNEVLEHVPDLSAALRDTARILRPGGKLIGTFPFNWGSSTTEIRARLTANGIEHLHPPEYHGNPVDPEGGSLVFQIPGWDILELCRASGFSDACMVFTGSTRLGITSREIPGVFVIEATR